MTTLLLVMLLAGCSGPATVSGTVVDEQGQTLTDVQMHVTAAVSTKYELDAYGGERTLSLDDGKFKVRCGNCSAAHLFFSKDGYHPQPVDLAWFERTRGLTVVLRRKGEPVDLEYIEARLLAGPGVAETVLQVDRKGMRERALEDIRADSVNAPARYIGIQPALTDDGAVAAVRSIDRPPVLDYMVLDFSAADGGVQLYKPSTRVIHFAFAEMTAAPQDGYQERIRIDVSEDFDNSYFYCVVDGRYGKGKITAPSVGRGERSGEVYVSIELYMSPHIAHRSMENARGYL